MTANLDPDAALADLVEANPARARVFENRDLDYCCGGGRSLRKACEAEGYDLEAILDDLEEVDARTAPDDEIDFDSMTEIVDFIVDTHHDYLRDELGPLGDLIETVVDAHGDNHPELYDLADVFDDLARELPRHLSEEEQVLFPAVRKLDDEEASEVEKQTARATLGNLEDDHDETAEHLEEIRRLTDGYQAPDDACPKYENMLERLGHLERDMHMHIHRENNVLFPAVRAPAS
ncbi:MAG: iron-sulfur cluster repair di-iron protein [Bradymonadaceae bacterium]